jgi:hypothetical protein
MANNPDNIITREAQSDTLNILTTDQVSKIEGCVEVLNSVKSDNKISEKTLRELTSVLRELDSLRELFYLRLFNSLKRGDMLLR